MNMAQLTVLKLLVGMNNLELNIDKISEYLRIMATHKATPTVIPPEALRSLLRKVIQQLRPNLRLRLPYNPEGTGIWKYYDNIRVYAVLTDNMLVILLTIPILDTTLELNIYWVHNLPAIPPGHQLAATYQLEGEYFAVGKHGVYVALPHHDTVVRCINSNLAICQMDQALYLARTIKWCVYALFIQDEERVKKYCKYTISKAEQNSGLSLGGYLWAISAVTMETLQIRCLLETHVVTIHPPLQIIYVGNGCEGFSSSVFIPAKSDQAVIEEIEPRQKYFLEFNEIYEPDQYIGLWYQFEIVLMNKSEAQKFVTKVKSFGTLDFALLNKHIQPLPIQKGGGFPVTPMILIVGVGYILTIIAGILFACKLQQVGLASSALTSTAKAVTEQILISKFRNLFQKRQPNKPQLQPETGIELQPVSLPRDPRGPAPADNLDDPTISSLIHSAFSSERDVRRYAKWFETKAAVQQPMIPSAPSAP